MDESKKTLVQDDHNEHDEHKHHHEHEHHHEHGEHCCCGHSHEHEEHDEHEHEHHHEHGEHCCCGHSHEHGEHGGHEHHHEHVTRIPEVLPTSACVVYVMKNIDCANCSAKIEAKIRELPEVDDAILTFATRQLRVYSSAGTSLLPKMQEIADRIEPGTKIEVREARGKQAVSTENEEHSHDNIEILSGGALFLAGLLLSSRFPTLSSIAYVLSYIILGKDVVMTALKNLSSGHVLDENFLMSIATIGAFIIGDFAEAVGVMIFYRIGEAFEHKAVEKSRSQIMDAVDLRPETVLLDENGTTREIPAELASVGQIIQVRPGDRIPLDGVIVDGESRLDTSPITGEPVPVAVKPGASVLSGCVNTSGLLKLRVEKELSESMVTRILDSVENAAASKPQAERFITKFARIYTPVVVGLAAATAIIPSLVTGNWSHWIYTALTFLVISCPCALVLSVPLAFFSGIGAGSKKGILFKGGIALEALKDVKVVVMDKTGTITKGNFVVQEILPVSGMEKNTLLSLAAACESSSTHPIGESILAAAKEQALTVNIPEELNEFPGKGVRAVISQKTILCGNRKLLEENNVSVPSFSSGASTMVFLAENGTYIGSISISDTVKPEAVSAIASLKKMNIRTAMLTGDSEQSAAAVAKETGIDTVFSKLLPGDKLNILKELRKEHGNAMFVGDGINDAPVLAGADVGAAMGSGADAAIEAADVVFMTSSMEAIPASIRIAKKTGAIALQNVVFALAIKILVMLLGLFGYASMWMAVFADSGVAMLCVLNSIRILYEKQ